MNIPVLKTLEEYNKFYFNYLISKGFYKDPKIDWMIKNISDGKKIEGNKNIEFVSFKLPLKEKYKISVALILPNADYDKYKNEYYDTYEKEKFEVSSFEQIPKLLEQAINQIEKWDDLPEIKEHIIQQHDQFENDDDNEWNINPSLKNQKLREDIINTINRIAQILKYPDVKILRTRIVKTGISYFFNLNKNDEENIILPLHVTSSTNKKIEWHKKIIKLIVFEIKVLKAAGYKPEYIGLDANYNLEKGEYTIGILPEWRLKNLNQKNNNPFPFENMGYCLPIGKDKDLVSYWTYLFIKINTRIQNGEDIYKDIFNVEPEPKHEHIIQQQDQFENDDDDNEWNINPIKTFSVPKFMDNPKKQKYVIITVPHKGEKFARKVAKQIESKYNVKTFINYKISRKKTDFNRLNSRSSGWRKDLTNNLIYADMVLDLHDSVFDINNDIILVFNSSFDWNKQNIQKFTQISNVSIIPEDYKNDILNECESYGIPCAVFEFNRFTPDDKVCSIADKIINVIEENTFNNVKILNGRICPKCRTFYDENKKKCNVCGGKLKNRNVKQKCNE